ncbi:MULTISPECIES: TonB-dependent receptor [Pandoraea]|uniref:TonB-dependent receptor family protein n=1 Tax=Pandoraea TaxID=93217 RepID=UPI001F5C6970|nr:MULTISPECIES: TonB-dependent receptor [Pandoraea]MCI3206148.1 TonB-dependent receptor [Pandoraea sp. LA3]MDN4584176.1 TonB-dependent receptor [Pandoraea capi]
MSRSTTQKPLQTAIALALASLGSTAHALTNDPATTGLSVAVDATHASTHTGKHTDSYTTAFVPGAAAAAPTEASPLLLAQTTVPAAPGSAAAPVATLPATNVVAPAESLTSPSVEEQRANLFQTAGSVGFVDADSYQNTYAFNLRDVLKDSPGVFVQNRYGQELRVSIRGSGIARGYHVRGLEILQDGIPTNSADGSGDYYQIDPMGLRSTEIYKGGNGLTYGATTLGGALNFVTPTAYTAEAPNQFRLEGGSFGTVRASGQMSRIFGPLDALATVTLNRSDGYRDHAKGNYAQINANIGYKFSPRVETRFFFGAYIVDQKLPGTLSLFDALNNPTKAAASAVSGDQARNTRTERLGNLTTIRFDVGQLDIASWVIHKSLYHPIFQVIDQDGWTYGVAPRYTANLTLAGMRNDLIVGARFFGGNTKADQYVNVNGNRGAQTLDSRQSAYNYEAYFENRLFFLPTLGLMVGAKAYRDVRQYIDYGGLPGDANYRSTSAAYSGVNPKIGLIWEPRKDIQAFIDVTRSADVPDFTDLSQTFGATSRFVPLASQHAWTIEAGTRGKLDRVAWDVTAYRSLVRDQLLQYTTNPDVPASTFNANKTVLQGLEVGASVDLLKNVVATGDRITLSQIWNYSDFRFRDDPQYGNNRIAGVPTQVLRTTLGYALTNRFQIAASLDWVPTGAWVDYANTMRVPGYTLIGLQASYLVQRGVTFYVDARNLTDKRYVSDFSTVTDARTANTAVFYPGDGRSVFAGVRFAF